MMATITSASVGELLKELYAPWEIEDQVQLVAPILADCARKGTAQLGGNNFRFAVRTQSAHGHAYISESDDLPAGRESEVLTAVVNPTVHAGVVQLTGLSMAVSSGDGMAFARAFDENVQQTLEAMTWYKEGTFFRDGVGIVAQFNGAVAATAGPHVCDDVNHLREGMVVDILNSDSTVRHNTDLEILEVDWLNRDVTFTTAVAGAVDDNDRIFMADSQANTGALVVKEPIGLEASLLDSGTYLGISRTTFPNWQSNVISASAFLDEDLLMRARTRITQESGIPLSGMGASFAVLAHQSQLDVLFRLAAPRIRFSGNESFDLGYSDTIRFGDIPLKSSPNCPSNVAYMGPWEYSVTLYTPGGELHIDTEYNGSALKWVATADQGLVFLKEYANFAVKRPNAFVRFTSLTEATR